MLGLVFIAIWRKEIILEYVDKFLKIFGESVAERYREEIKLKGDIIVDAPNFTPQFRAAFDRWNVLVGEERTKRKIMATFEETEHGKKILKNKKSEGKPEVKPKSELEDK